MIDDSQWKRVAALIQPGNRILVITGAGMSADSGLPTYRGVSGLYNVTDTEDGIPIERALSGPMFQRRPQLTWKYIHQLERSCRGAEPNLGHKTLAQWEKNGVHMCVLTQNVDGLHERAGSKGIIPIHGTLRNILCTTCKDTRVVEDYEGLPPLPLCEQCNGVLRPRVVLFGEALPQEETSTLYRETALGFDLVMSIGTTSVFPYIAAPMRYAREWGALAIEVNPATTEVSPYADLRFPLRSVPFFERLMKDVVLN